MAKTNTDILKQINKGKTNRTAKRQERKQNPKYAPIRTGSNSVPAGTVKTCWLNAVNWNGKVFAEHQLMAYDPTIDVWVSEDRMTVLHNDDIVFDREFNHGIYNTHFFASKRKTMVDAFIIGNQASFKVMYEMIPEGMRMQFQSEETFKKTKHKTIKG